MACTLYKSRTNDVHFILNAGTKMQQNKHRTAAGLLEDKQTCDSYFAHHNREGVICFVLFSSQVNLSIASQPRDLVSIIRKERGARVM
jgi:hypothetical protein